MNKAAGCSSGFTADKLHNKLNLSAGYMKSCVNVNMYLSRYIDSDNIALFAQVPVAPTNNSLWTTLGGADTPSAVMGWSTPTDRHKRALYMICHGAAD